ncbi:hypothetical protein H0H87_006290 [Tephrocybe sp. NHM501043]|nr:hypothetical protein H0H87_006290 [Tephrocybe sp. NHM501043]
MMRTLTLTSRSSASLLRALHALRPAPSPSPLLFALSPNVEPPALSRLVDRIGALAPTTLGCLSAPLRPGHVSCALAWLPETAVVFRSTLRGREAPQVGRWHAFRERASDEQQGEFSTGWAGRKRREALPEGLQGVKCVGRSSGFIGSNGCRPTGIFYFTDRAPEGLLSALEAFPGVPSLGLIASSTPFITGRPVTLFHNGSIYDSGAIGVALATPSAVTTSFTGCVPISPAMPITDCEGNMVNALGGESPTQLLLGAIRKSGMDMDAAGSFKDDETFLLGDERGSRMYRITAGDPSRGPISLEPQNAAPPVGSLVQFFHLPKQPQSPLVSTVIDGSFNLRTCSEEQPVAVDEAPASTEESGSFVAGSENGFVLSQGCSAWTCTVRGGQTSLYSV